ncbi:hypothetical protein Maes01_02102 [Microbulbifer aestuariivivens]|uniref:Polysaccharide biosynthesis protein n=1 Tax=Microbulbifer aestuariivivens TaxID=1908308 RepID=A0ABP9WQP1_9GAMM
MSLRLSLLKGASVLTVSQALVAACTFFRNVIIARHIDTENFGVASTFALTITLVEMTSHLALDRVLVQDREGGRDDMLASAHLLQFLKGLLIGAIQFAIAAPIAHLFGIDDKVWAFQLLAVVHVLTGFMHFDFVVRQRRMEFLPTAIFDALPQILTVMVALAATLVFEDYRVMLAVILLQTLMQVALSHLLARRPYRWALRRQLARRKLIFAWPLLVNGILMLGIFQGDRFIIGSFYDMQTLGWYSVAFSLCLLPTLLFAKLSGNLLMPILAQSRDDKAFYERCCQYALIGCFSFAVVMVVFFTVAGYGLVHVSFGEQYLQAAEVIAWLTGMQALRVVRMAPSIIANSQGHTKNIMIANIFRSTGLGLAVALGIRGVPVTWIAATGIAGEAIALAVSVSLVQLGDGKGRFVGTLLQLALTGTLICGLFISLIPPLLPAPDDSLALSFLQLAIGAVSALLAAALLALSQAPVRKELLALLRPTERAARVAAEAGR